MSTNHIICATGLNIKNIMEIILDKILFILLIVFHVQVQKVEF